MTTSQFYNETAKVAERLLKIGDRISRTREVLERLVHCEEISIASWNVQEGRIHIAFDVVAELEHLPDNERHIQETLTALFPNCRICGTLLEIESTELL